MRVCFILAALAVVALARPHSEEVRKPLQTFSSFKAAFGKTYATPEEEAKREAIFNDWLVFVAKHNAEYEQGRQTYFVGVNQFSDLTNAEYKALYLSSYVPQRERNYVTLPEATAASVDWRTSGAVTPIKNQGQCGSCWAFSTTGSVEGAWKIAGHTLVSLSEQQLMDCSTAQGNQGCNGGLMDDAFKYIIANGGIDTEADYGYTARDGTCNTAKQAKKVATITGYSDVPANSETQLAAAVAIGPVSVAIEADQAGFQGYTGGVFSGPCGTQLDHGVLAVGYTDSYWIVKNSWGTSWGAQGYIFMKRGVSASGICGIAMMASYPKAGSGPAPPPPPPGPAPPPPPPAGGHYGDPAKGPCQSDEIAVQVTGLPGDFCSPNCSPSSACPTDIPDGATARPECILETSGSSQPTNCCLVCNPGENAQCPTNASCKAIQGIGICTYDD